MSKFIFIIFLLAIIAPLRAQTLPIGLVSKYPTIVTSTGDVINGLVARYFTTNNFSDSIGGHNGTGIGSPTFSTNQNGVANSAVVFDGSSQAVTAAPMSLAGTANYTVCTWFKEMAGNTYYDRIISAESSPNTGFVFVSGLGAGDPNIYCFQATSGAGIPNSTFAGGVTTTWNFLVQTYDGTTMKDYVNGVFQVSATTTASSATTSPLAFGEAGFGSSSWWSGSLGETSFYNRALSGSEVMQLYNFEQ